MMDKGPAPERLLEDEALHDLVQQGSTDTKSQKWASIKVEQKSLLAGHMETGKQDSNHEQHRVS
jgi:hypothetical protein